MYTPKFLKETIAAAKEMTYKPLLVRMDSGNGALENYVLMYWDDPRIKFLVKHIFRRENREELAENLRKCCQNISSPREGKTLYIGSTWRTFHAEEKGDITIRIVYEIIDRTMSGLALGRGSPWANTFIRIFGALSAA